MAHDELLATRMRAALGSLPGLEEKKMFGGTGFLVDGNMACGVHKKNMIVRVGPEKHAWALAHPHTRPFDMTGRSMSGWIEVEPPGCATEKALKAWVDLGLAFALSLPAK
ncbi:MAG: TfoX/Sxy family protein [Anaerolineales bacterium]|jgi:TfoX/Sxy family transcriptional regulator of competence genes